MFEHYKKEVIGSSIVTEDEAGLEVIMNITDAGAQRLSEIVSPDAPTTVNEKGGGQSYVPVRFDLIDGPALFEMAKVLHHGAEKYGENNWRLIDVPDHLNHLIMHAYAYLSGDETDDHLSHILCRAMFALGVKLEENNDTSS